MKNYSIMALALLVTSVSANATPAKKLQLPDSLQCNAVLEVFGNPARRGLDLYQGIKLQNLNSKEEMKWNEDAGVLRSQDDKIILDFGVGANGGDQYSTFTFLADDVANFMEGKQATLSGLYEDGYDWADGYHTRGEFVVHCSK